MVVARVEKVIYPGASERLPKTQTRRLWRLRAISAGAGASRRRTLAPENTIAAITGGLERGTAPSSSMRCWQRTTYPC